MSVDLVVIPAAGRGTRMRPATRSVPKALVTLMDRPTIQYAVEEAARAGVHEAILIVDLAAASAIDHHFSGEGPLPGLEEVQIRIVVQEEPHGLGHAVLTAREAVGDRSFYCSLVDTIAGPNAAFFEALAEASDGQSVIGLEHISGDLFDRYGVVGVAAEVSTGVVEINQAIEKPGEAAAPSDLGIFGRYLFSPEIFDALAVVEPGYGGEIQLTDAIDTLARAGRCRGAVVPGELLDVGNPLGMLIASTVLGLASEAHGLAYREFLEQVD